MKYSMEISRVFNFNPKLLLYLKNQAISERKFVFESYKTTCKLLRKHCLIFFCLSPKTSFATTEGRNTGLPGLCNPIPSQTAGPLVTFSPGKVFPKSLCYIQYWAARRRRGMVIVFQMRPHSYSLTQQLVFVSVQQLFFALVRYYLHLSRVHSDP